MANVKEKLKTLEFKLVHWVGVWGIPENAAHELFNEIKGMILEMLGEGSKAASNAAPVLLSVPKAQVTSRVARRITTPKRSVSVKSYIINSTNLRRAIVNKRLTLATFSQSLGVARSTVGSWLKNGVFPARYLDTILILLGIDKSAIVLRSKKYKKYKKHKNKSTKIYPVGKNFKKVIINPFALIHAIGAKQITMLALQQTLGVGETSVHNWLYKSQMPQDMISSLASVLGIHASIFECDKLSAGIITRWVFDHVLLRNKVAAENVSHESLQSVLQRPAKFVQDILSGDVCPPAKTLWNISEFLGVDYRIFIKWPSEFAECNPRLDDKGILVFGGTQQLQLTSLSTKQ